MPYTTRRSLSITEKFQGGGGVGKEHREAEILRLHTQLASLTATHCYRCDDTNRFTNGHFCCPWGKQLFMCGRFPQGEIASGKFPWIRQKEQKNYPWQFPSEEILWVDKNPKWLNQSREGEIYQTVEIMCCLLAAFFLAPNPKRNWAQSWKSYQHF